jgi:hypothetical protein
MNHGEAVKYGLGYASGREDASGVRTASPDETPGFIAFAKAYASAWAEYNGERRGFMTSCRDAYDRWQASRGTSIWREDEQPARPLPEWVREQLALEATEHPH